MGLVLMGVLAWVFFLLAISVLTTASFPLFRQPLLRLHPKSRVIVLRALMVGPVVFGSFGVALCFAPKVLGGFFPQLDHCPVHADGHLHFCFNHPPHPTVPVEIWMGIALLAVVGVATFLVHGWRFKDASRRLRQLASTARFDGRHRAWVVEVDMPVAISLGLLRPRTLLSSGLLRIVPAHLIDAIVAHERAHERRKDGLWKLLTTWLTFGHFPGTLRSLRCDLELACEQACDEEAGAALGSRVRVAEALVAMERVRHQMLDIGPAAVAFGAHGLTQRIESLLAESAGWQGSRRTAIGLLAAICGLAIAAADPLHHLTETLLHYVLG